MCNDFDQAVVCDRHDVLNDKINFTLCKGVIFPIMDEGLVISLADARSPRYQFPLVSKFLRPQTTALHDAFRNFLHTLWYLEFICGQVTRNEIHFLCESLRFDQLLIIWIIVVKHGHCLPMFKSKHKNAISIQRSHTFWPYNSIEFMLFRPGDHPIEKRACGFQIVLTIEEIETGLLHAMIFVEWFIFDRGNAPHILPITDGQEKAHIRMFMEGMLPAVEIHIGVNIQRRHPLRTILV